MRLLRPFSWLLLLLAVWVGVACTPPPAEVTRIVPQLVTVEATRLVPEPIVEQVEVTRVVEVTPAVGPRGELRIALTSEPASLYAAHAAERSAQHVANQIYEGLIRPDGRGGFVPLLATAWEISPTGLSYTFTLRPGVVFHDGTPFTAEDVRATWLAGQDGANANAYLYKSAASVEIIDEGQVVISTATPNVLFLWDVARWGMISAEQYASGSWVALEQAPNGTGPFKLAERLADGRIRLEAHTAYWQVGQPYLASLWFVPLPEAAGRVAAVQTGQVHLATRLTAAHAQQLLGWPEVRVVRYPLDRVFYIAMSNLVATAEGEDAPENPLASPLVRQALNYAVNRPALGQRFFGGYVRLSTGLVTPSLLGFDEAIMPYPYDPEKARALLAEAGYAEGFTVGLACPAGTGGNWEGVCRAVAEDLAAVGVVLDENGVQLLDPIPFAEQQAARGLPVLFGDSWPNFTGEALGRLRWLVGAQSPYAVWRDPEIEAQLQGIEQEFDPFSRGARYEALSAYLWENPPFIYLYEPNTFEAVGAAVQNYAPLASEDYYLGTVYLAER